jgi:hypothetical protein
MNMANSALFPEPNKEYNKPRTQDAVEDSYGQFTRAWIMSYLFLSGKWSSQQNKTWINNWQETNSVGDLITANKQIVLAI